MAETLEQALEEYALYEEQKGTGIVNDELVIDPINRIITIPNSESTFGVFFDMNVERKYFRCPRYIGDNIDLSQHYIFVNYISASGNVGQYLCDDVKVDGEDITFSWLLSGNVFDENINGYIYFSVMAKKSQQDGTLITVFNTRKVRGSVYETVQAERIREQYADIIMQLLSEMDSVMEIATPEAMLSYVYRYLDEKGIDFDMVEINKTFQKQRTQILVDPDATQTKVPTWEYVEQIKNSLENIIYGNNTLISFNKFDTTCYYDNNGVRQPSLLPNGNTFGTTLPIYIPFSQTISYTGVGYVTGWDKNGNFVKNIGSNEGSIFVDTTEISYVRIAVQYYENAFVGSPSIFVKSISEQINQLSEKIL